MKVRKRRGARIVCNLKNSNSFSSLTNFDSLYNLSKSTVNWFGDRSNCFWSTQPFTKYKISFIFNPRRRLPLIKPIDPITHQPDPPKFFLPRMSAVNYISSIPPLPVVNSYCPVHTISSPSHNVSPEAVLIKTQRAIHRSNSTARTTVCVLVRAGAHPRDHNNRQLRNPNNLIGLIIFVVIGGPLEFSTRRSALRLF